MLRKIKVLFTHNNYQQPGGEDAVLQSEMSLLALYGQQAALISQKNNNISSITAKISAFNNVAYSKKSKQWMAMQIKQQQLDVVHVHNFFPLLSPSIYDACIKSSVPIVQTLHNYRTICPGALLMRDGNICEKCILGSPYNAVLYKCYRSSVLGSFAVARMVYSHRKKKTWNTKVNHFIALTEFSKNKFVEAGFPEHKISVKPNFTDDPIRKNEVFDREDNALFVGRISQEKGVDVMLGAWDGIKYPLTIAGDGPKLVNLKNENKNESVCFLAHQSKEQIHGLMSTARFLVMPSVCYEGFPMVLVEAFAHGLPVICSRLGGMAEIVEDGVTGLHFDAGNADDLAKKVRWVIEHPEECEQMGTNARFEYEQKYTPEKNYKMLMEIYQQAMDSNEVVSRELYVKTKNYDYEC